MMYRDIRLKIARLPGYPGLLKLGRERSDAIFIDLGCCCEYSNELDMPLDTDCIVTQSEMTAEKLYETAIQ